MAFSKNCGETNYDGKKFRPESEVLEKNLDLSDEGLQAILDEVSRVAPKIKAEELVHLRFLNEMKASGFFDKLWGKS